MKCISSCTPHEFRLLNEVPTWIPNVSHFCGLFLYVGNAFQTRHADGLDRSHVIILEHTAVSASKQWIWIKHSVGLSFNGAQLMLPILSQSGHRNAGVMTMTPIVIIWEEKRKTRLYCVSVWEQRITAVCTCWRPTCWRGFVWILFLCVWIWFWKILQVIWN